MHSAVYDLVLLSRHGVDLLGETVDCTRVLSHLLNEHTAHDLGNTAHRILGRRRVLLFRDLPPIETLDADVSEALLADKGRVDCEETLEVLQRFEAVLADRPRLRHAYLTVERPLLPVLASMTLTGVPVDVAALQAYRRHLHAEREAAAQRLHAAAGFALDPQHDDAVAAWLYGVLHLRPPAHTPAGRPAVHREALRALRHPAAALVLDARRIRSHCQAVERWLAAILSDGRAHPLYSAWSRGGGQVTASQPFARGEEPDGQALRVPVESFVTAPAGRAIVALRLQDARLHWLAHLSRDPVLLRAVDGGIDPARAVADALGKPDPATIAAAAAWLDALCTGRGPRTVARRLGCRQKDAAALGQAIRAVLPGVARLKTHLEQAGLHRGWVQAPLGRRRRFEPRYMARQALADLLEAAAADTFKVGLRRLWEMAGPSLILASGATALLEVAARDAAEAARQGARLMSLPCAGIPWPFAVAASAGCSWAQAQPVGGTRA
jgi:DNA polymerase-1